MRIALPLVLLALFARPAAAEDLVTDLRLGVLQHDTPILGEQHEHGIDLNGEILFASPVPEAALTGIAPGFRWLLRPAPNLGASTNTAGDTSQVYLGATWTVSLDNGGLLWPDGTVFLGIGFGPAFNTGRITSRAANKLSLGSNVLFHPSLELGWRLTPRWSVSAYYDHSSNAGLARSNAGLNDLGLRLGLRF